MAVHVPFSQRPSGRKQAQPVYIGFEPSARKRPKFNWWGFNGLFLFFLSLGALSPITLLISLVGLRRKPRKMAVAGTIFSLIGTTILAGIVISGIQHAEQARQRAYERQLRRANAEKIADTEAMLADAATEFEQYRDDHDGKLPTDMDGALLAIKHIDPWGAEIMYEVNRESATLRSSGPDNEFFTPDDVTHPIGGETDTEPLLPVD